MRGRLRPWLLPISLLGLTAWLLSTGPALADKSSHSHTAPLRLAPPRISGSAQVGDVLRVSPGRWAKSARFVYRWKACNRDGASCAAVRRQKTHGARPRVQTY